MVPNPPRDMPRITPHLFYDDVAAAIDWLVKAFGCEIRLRMTDKAGAVVHGEVELKDSLVMLGLAAGSLFGVSDVSIKAVTSGAHGLLGVLGPWTFVGIFAGLGAFFASARSLQIGNAVATIVVAKWEHACDHKTLTRELEEGHLATEAELRHAQ